MTDKLAELFYIRSEIPYSEMRMQRKSIFKSLLICTNIFLTQLALFISNFIPQWCNSFPAIFSFPFPITTDIFSTNNVFFFILGTCSVRRWKRDDMVEKIVFEIKL
jgi:hypothetical protein